MYMAMQKLLNTFLLETLPLCINFLLKENKSFMDKIDDILGVTLETQPDLTVREVMSKLLDELKNSALKVHTHGACAASLHGCTCECSHPVLLCMYVCTGLFGGVARRSDAPRSESKVQRSAGDRLPSR